MMEITGDHYLDDEIYKQLHYFNLLKLNKEYYHKKYYYARTYVLLSYENKEKYVWEPVFKTPYLNYFLADRHFDDNSYAIDMDEFILYKKIKEVAREIKSMWRIRKLIVKLK